MLTSRSLLQRLEFPESQAERDMPGDSESLIDSVCQHLHLMFNTRQGNSLTAPEFGTADFAGLSRGFESVNKVQEEIRRSIERYEPRLRDVQVRFRQDEDQPFTMHFDIFAQVDLRDGSRPTRFRSTIESNGEINVARR